MIDTKVEIQIRTIAMDFWASLEHKIYYKFEGDAPEYISRDLQECAGIVSMLDAKMLSLNEAILQAREKQENLRQQPDACANRAASSLKSADPASVLPSGSVFVCTVQESALWQ